MIRLLLADDDTDDVELFCEAVLEVEPDVMFDAKYDGVGVIEKLKDANYPVPDIIVLDINMPNINGWTALKRIRQDERYSRVPVFIYSTSSMERDKQIASNLGANGFFTKPEKFAAVKELIKIMLHSCGLKSKAF